VLAAIESGEVQQVMALVSIPGIPCVPNASGVAAPPTCLPGQAAGTLAPVFPFPICEGRYVERQEVERVLRVIVFAKPPRLYAVYEPAEDSFGNRIPLAQYVISLGFEGPQPAGLWEVAVRDGAITAMSYCSYARPALTNARRVILPPPTAVTTTPTPTGAPSLPQSLAPVVTAILRSDADAIRALTVRVPSKCGVETNCPAGIAPGTMYPIIRAMGCEPLQPDDNPGGIDGTLGEFTSRPRVLLAVFEEMLTDPVFGWIPRGSHEVVVWTIAMSRASAFHVADGRITGIEFGCGHKPEQYYEGVDPSRFLVGPTPYP
jgi:hypothetical protein